MYSDYWFHCIPVLSAMKAHNTHVQLIKEQISCQEQMQSTSLTNQTTKNDVCAW